MSTSCFACTISRASGPMLATALLLSLGTTVVFSATYVVTNTNDAGPGSLRQAIVDANTNIGADDIAFNIPGPGPHTISPLTDLPWISGPTSIDGWTQGGLGYSGPPIIEIEGSRSTGGNNQIGLDIRARNCLIRGLVLNRWSYQIHLFGDDMTGVANAGACQIQGNYIGLDVTGTTVPGTGNSAGIEVYFSDNNTIGGSASALRNIVAGNYYEIWISGANASGNVIQGNYIGTDVTGLNDPHAYGGDTGIHISEGSNNQIGGNGFAGEYNIISGEWSYGICITGSHARYNRIQGNVIGTDAMATGDLGNGAAGVYFTGYASHSIVGGIGTGELNIIANNGHNSGLLDPGGVVIDDGCTSIAVSANSIYDNGNYGDLGIDLNSDGVTPNDPGDADSGANTLLNFPVVDGFATAGGNTYISGTLNSTPNALFALEFFSNQWADVAGYGEGETFIGLSVVKTNASGNVSFTHTYAGTIPDEYCITATTTSIDSCTSEFSQAVYYVDPILSGARVGPQHVLTWDAVPGASSYWVFGQSNDAYFDPDLSGFTNRQAVVPAPTLTWATSAGIGDITNNWTYMVVAVDAGGLELARTDYVGEHDFDLP